MAKKKAKAKSKSKAKPSSKAKPKAKTKLRAKSKPKTKPKSKPAAKPKPSVGDGPYPPVDICNGGTVSAGSQSAIFANGTGAPCTITTVDRNLFPVPQHIAPGLNTVPFTHAVAAGDAPYSYHPTCCGGGTDPVIKVQ